ncbi:hypothetical protein B0H10DRAFT_2438832 [Mycena sp. CBHHK59/15]|nr:hypothetical protein B0H10DRAFT_2438832 [Mycena sp. CBHHK59/15]
MLRCQQLSVALRSSAPAAVGAQQSRQLPAAEVRTEYAARPPRHEHEESISTVISDTRHSADLDTVPGSSPHGRRPTTLAATAARQRHDAIRASRLLASSIYLSISITHTYHLPITQIAAISTAHELPRSKYCAKRAHAQVH